MVRTSLYWVTGVLALGLALWGGDALRRAQDAAALAKEAELVLTVPLSRASELSTIQAARAVMLLEDANRRHDSPAIAGWLAHARALDAYQKGKLERARQQLALAEARLGPSAERSVLAAQLASDEGEHERAAQLLQQALTTHAEHPRVRLLAADLALDAGDAPRALPLIEALLQEQPGLAALHNRHGLALEATGDIAPAMQAYLRAAELDTRLHQPLVNVGRLRHAAGELRAAEDAFTQAIARAEAEAEAWLGRGLSRRAQGDLAGGALDIEKARELSPGAPAPLLAQADVDAQEGRLDEALQRYRAVLVITPEDAVAWLKLGNALVRAGQHEDARSTFEEAIRRRPDMAAAHNGLGAVLAALGQHEEAAAMLIRASELDAADPNPLLNLARLRRKQGNAKAAAQAEQAALALR